MYVGIDCHKRFAVATKMDARGEVLEQVRLANTEEDLGTYLCALPPETAVAVEATGNWSRFYEMIEERDLAVTLAHPYKTRAIAAARIKTDKIDSTMLAHLLRTNLLPAAYIPPRSVRDLRELLRYRASLVSLRTQIKNKVQAILSKPGTVPPVKHVFGKKGTRFLEQVPLRSCYRTALDGYLTLLQTLQTERDRLGEVLATQAQADSQARLLQTIPGIGTYSALRILSEIGEIDRFPDARRLCSYAGLVPSVHASGGTTRRGPLTKQGSKWLRWILIETSLHAVNGAPQFRSLYWRVQRKHGANTARVAVARAVLKTIYAMLRTDKPFEARPRRVRITGQRPGVIAAA
ncbi:MAG: IS110 family transposase [Nitrospirae bacterium]|nr:IS110 family transposase [Nitrospirota bacterium]